MAKGLTLLGAGEGGKGLCGIALCRAPHQHPCGEGFGIPEKLAGSGGAGPVGIEGGVGNFFRSGEGIVEIASGSHGDDAVALGADPAGAVSGADVILLHPVVGKGGGAAEGGSGAGMLAAAPLVVTEDMKIGCVVRDQLA